MDGFDDLLAPSRSVLEENPFANPFSNDRPHSPDPWSSPFASSQHHDVFGASSTEDPYTVHQDTFQPSTSDIKEEEEERDTSTVKEEESPLSDPLDSAAHANDDDGDSSQRRTSPRLPGFRQSIETPDTNFSETATIRPAEPENFDGSPVISRAGPLTPPSSEEQQDSRDPQRKKSGFISHIEETTPKQDFVPPLDNRSTTGIGHSGAAGLSLVEALDNLGIEQGAWGSSSEPVQTTSYSVNLQDDDDSEDDKPISQTLSRIQLEEAERSKLSSLRQGPRTDNGIQPVFVITVGDPQKVGDPIRSYTMYTVHTRTTSPLYEKSSFSVLRRYSDFLWLYETMQANNPGVVVPPVPEKNTFNRFDDAFVRQRRLALEKCIQKIANHPVLGKDPDLKFFLESDTFALDVKHRKAESHERGGLIASIGQTLTGPRFHETDEWFDRQKLYVDSLESQLKGLVKAIEVVAKHRTEVATTLGEFAQTISDLASSDIGSQLSQSLSGLAAVQRKAQELQMVQSDQDMVTIMATADEYSRLINSVRLAFSSRIRIYHQWKNSENDLLRIKRNHEKNRAQGQIPSDRLSYSLQQIAEAERRASESKMEYEQVSKLVKQEVARFERERIDDLKDSLHAFLEGMISRQKELISTWEDYQQILLKKVDTANSPNAMLQA